MVHFETEVGNGAPRPGPVAGFANQARTLVGDLLELAELQAKLAKADAVEATQAAVRPAVMLVLGACAAIASLPVITLGLANLLGEASSLSIGQSQLLVGCVVAIAALVVVTVSLRKFRGASLRFRRSADELAKNMAWAKAAVRSDR